MIGIKTITVYPKSEVQASNCCTNYVRKGLEMRKKSLVLTLAVALIATTLIGGTALKAQVDVEALPSLALDSLFSALNEGDTVSALNAFDTGASVTNLPIRESYLDADEIAGMLEEWNRDGRRFAIATGAVTSIAPGLEMVTSDVEITDRGVTWGSQRLLGVVYNGKIQRLYVVHARLTPSQYW
jgi:hypothetical protein